MASITTVGAIAAFLPASNAIINGRSHSDAILQQGGKTYVDVAALKSAGAQVATTEKGVQINFLPLDGRNQVDAVEGKLQEWIQNDLWRIRVESVSEANSPFGRGPGAGVKIAFRNLGKRPASPYGTGMDKLTLMDGDDQVISFQQSSFKAFFQDIAPGGEVSETIRFGDPANKISKLGEFKKLMIFFRVTGGKKAKDIRVFLD
jgi:hypothetical protein